MTIEENIKSVSVSDLVITKRMAVGKLWSLTGGRGGVQAAGVTLITYIVNRKFTVEKRGWQR